MNTAMSAPNNWPFFQQNLNDDDSSYVRSMSEYSMFSSRISSAPTTTVTTVAAASSSSVAGMPAAPMGSSSSAVSGSFSHNLNPEGRVAKPARRRSRASRRTPTTLFNTDTTNFRAMVQQFTGGPSSPFTLGGGARQAHVNPGPAVMLPTSSGGGYQLQYQPLQDQAYTFPMSGGTGNPGEVLVQRLGGGGRGGNSRADVEGSGFLEAGVSSQVPTSRTSSSATNENRGNLFMY